MAKKILPEARKSANMNFLLDWTTRAKLEEMARREDLTLSDIIRRAIRMVLALDGGGGILHVEKEAVYEAEEYGAGMKGAEVADEG